MVDPKQAAAWCLTIVLSVGMTGCGSQGGSTGGGASMDDMAAAVTAQKAAEEQQRLQAEEAQPDTESADQPPAEAPRRAAGRPGVGEGGYYTAIVGARRHVLNRVDRLAWLQGVQHFQAEHGRLPKDHAEFMSRIVEFHGIDLGYKEEDQEFLYDPSEGDWGEVYVVESVEESDS